MREANRGEDLEPPAVARDEAGVLGGAGTELDAESDAEEEGEDRVKLAVEEDALEGVNCCVSAPAINGSDVLGGGDDIAREDVDVREEDAAHRDAAEDVEGVDAMGVGHLANIVQSAGERVAPAHRVRSSAPRRMHLTEPASASNQMVPFGDMPNIAKTLRHGGSLFINK